MGGNAFPHLSLVRVNRADVFPTVKFVVDTLQVEGFTYEYACAHMMGSAGKQDDSGDLDFAMNNKSPRFVGQKDLPRFNLKAVAARCREVLPDRHVDTKTLRGGQFQSAWPVAGDWTKGLVQVDFVSGDPEWLTFSHFSPGKDVSPWKGVMMSTMLGVLAKLHKEFELRGNPLPGCDVGPRLARVGWHFDLEQGLHRRWELSLREGHGLSKVDPDFFETKVPSAPRFSRVGYLTEPEAVLSFLFNRPTTHEDVNTFEKMVARVKLCFPNQFGVVYERLVDAYTRSAGRHTYEVEEVGLADVWFQ